MMENYVSVRRGKILVHYMKRFMNEENDCDNNVERDAV